MEVPSLLCNSFLCRLCADENKSGTKIFPAEENDPDLSQLINKYLPLKVSEDGKLPQMICPGCYIQLEATKQFLDRIIDGQKKLRDLYQVQHENFKLQEKRRQHLENTLKTYNPESSVKTFVQTDETGKKFFIQVLSDGPLFPAEHELSLRAEGLERPRRRRGRPPKTVPINSDENETQKETSEIQKDGKQESEDEPEIDGDGRRRRKIKVPSRFQEVVQGKELERIFKEEGVIDDDSLSEDERQKSATDPLAMDEVIGHLQSKEGDDLGELIIVNRNTNRIKHKSKHDTSPKRKKKHECEICGKEFLHHSRYEAHKLLHKDSTFVCNETDCNLRFSSKSAIEEHQKEAGHGGITLLECIEDKEMQLQNQEDTEIIEKTEPEVSLQSFGSEHDESIESNMDDSTNSANKHTCEACGKSFTCRQNLDVHVKAVHENLKPHQCNKCDKSFPYLNSLKFHLLKHVDKNEKLYPCEVCNKIFNHPSSLVYHREAEHNNGRRFVCIKCDKSFKHKQLLQRHQLVHSDERPHRCKQCDASFKTRANLLNHMPIHTGEKKYFCSQCGHTFAHKTSLTLHIRWHSGQKPYQCDVCLKSFSQKGNLAEHKRIHTGEKPYCCDHCGRKFTTSSQYKLHVKRHTGERPWRCEYCSKTFLHKDTWKCHTRRHRNERPYQCQLCLRGFTEQWALKKHERLHTGEKPYVCEFCNRSFADCSNLTKHRKVHMNENVKKDISKIKLLTSTKEDQNNVYYVTLEPNSSDEQSQTLVHIMDQLDSTVSENENLTTTNMSDENDLLTTPNSPARESTGLQVQQIFDQEGNPLSVTLSDGQSLRVVTTVEDGQQNIQGLMADGTLVPMNIGLEDGKAVITNVQVPVEEENSKENKLEDATKKVIESKMESAAIGQLIDNSIQFLSENGQKIDTNMQFLMEDGQNICFVATYNVDDSINSQYLAMA